MPAVLDAMIQRVVERMYADTDENQFLEVTTIMRRLAES